MRGGAFLHRDKGDRHICLNIDIFTPHFDTKGWNDKHIMLEEVVVRPANSGGSREPGSQ